MRCLSAIVDHSLTAARTASPQPDCKAEATIDCSSIHQPNLAVNRLLVRRKKSGWPQRLSDAIEAIMKLLTRLLLTAKHSCAPP
jgi:hypothetical protein